VWDPAVASHVYSEEHPLKPKRLVGVYDTLNKLGTFALPGAKLLAPRGATSAELARVHDPDYIDAVMRASSDPRGDYAQWGLDPRGDTPPFRGMHDVSLLTTGGSLVAMEESLAGTVRVAANFSGGLHHAMRRRASGFCIYNDPAIVCRALADRGLKVAYVDIDAHHGDGVQAAFYDDPRVLTVSIHESPLTLFPGTGWPAELGSGAAQGTSANLALPPGTSDAAWLRAFHAVVPGLVRAFRPEVLVTQHGADSHREDPLADLNLTIDGQRTSYVALRDLAESVTGGRWLALGGGGYSPVRVVPRAWTHLLAIVAGRDLDPRVMLPEDWIATAAKARPDVVLPVDMNEGTTSLVAFDRWDGTQEMAVDRAIQETRNKLYPLHGLDPHDPRD
jgi:acetoin utilization protein AcuC